MLRKVLAFIKKDFLFESSYKISFIFNIFGVLVSLLSFFFIDKLFGQRMVSQLDEFGVNYFAYVLLAMAFFNFIGVGLGSFASRLYLEQIQGTLEAILLTPTKESTILFSMGLWNLIIAFFDMIIYILLAIFLFKINFANINLLSAIIVLLLAIVSFSSLGILSACFIMVFKRFSPIDWVINSVGGLISGVYFPVAILPGWLRFAANFSPITYAVRAVELAVYKGYPITRLFNEISFLLAFSILLLPAGILTFKFVIRKAKMEGSLLGY